MQFVVKGLDGSDSGALERRMSARQAHVESFEKGKAQGTFIFAAALLDAENKMVGSLVFCDFPSRAEVEAWLEQEPYVLGDVWRTVEISPCKILPSCLPQQL